MVGRALEMRLSEPRAGLPSLALLAQLPKVKKSAQIRVLSDGSSVDL